MEQYLYTIYDGKKNAFIKSAKPNCKFAVAYTFYLGANIYSLCETEAEANELFANEFKDFTEDLLNDPQAGKMRSTLRILKAERCEGNKDNILEFKK